MVKHEDCIILLSPQEASYLQSQQHQLQQGPCIENVLSDLMSALPKMCLCQLYVLLFK